jgi:hypothetical protein
MIYFLLMLTIEDRVSSKNQPPASIWIIQAVATYHYYHNQGVKFTEAFHIDIYQSSFCPILAFKALNSSGDDCDKCKQKR